MKFEPKTEQEVEESGLLPKGEYDFEIVSAEDTTSKKGNDMIALKLHVYNTDGSYKTVLDWLLEAISYKLRHFAYCIGKGDEYETGTLSADGLTGCVGRCRLIIQKQEGYSAKNSVADYIVPKNGAAEPRAVDAKMAQSSKAALDDEIPF